MGFLAGPDTVKPGQPCLFVKVGKKSLLVGVEVRHYQAFNVPLPVLFYIDTYRCLHAESSHYRVTTMGYGAVNVGIGYLRFAGG